MHISRKCAQVLLPPPKVDNVPLEMVECYKYLGVIITNDMSWVQQIQPAKAKDYLAYCIGNTTCIAILQLFLNYTLHMSDQY